MVVCRDPLTFRECYGVSEAQCLDWADDAVKLCRKRLPPAPPPPTKPEEVTGTYFSEWSVNLGHCVEEVYETAHAAQFTATAECTKLLSERRALRRGDMYQKFEPYSRPRPGAAPIWPPVIGGILTAVLFLHWRTKKGRVSFLAGALSWLLFFVTAFAVEFASHALFPQLYRRLGDNPEQIAGLATAFFLSFLLNPIFWIYFRFKKK